jgi:hypothetical protein
MEAGVTNIVSSHYKRNPVRYNAPDIHTGLFARVLRTNIETFSHGNSVPFLCLFLQDVNKMNAI